MARFCFLIMSLSAAVMTVATAAKQFRVGGTGGRDVPPDNNKVSYNEWAKRQRFQIGDTLLFVYPPKRDSVLVVDQNAYKSCNTSSFINKFNNGYTVFTLTHAGPHYFISGNRNNCLKNEQMIVVVLAKHRPSPATHSPPPPPASPSGTSSKVTGFMGSIGVFLGFLFLGL